VREMFKDKCECTHGVIGMREPPHVLNIFGPLSFLIRSIGVYFVIYSLPDGNTFVAELTLGETCYEIVRQTRFLGHQSMIAAIPYYGYVNLQELFSG